MKEAEACALQDTKMSCYVLRDKNAPLAVGYF